MLKPGDTIEIHKPDDINEMPCWLPEMERHGDEEAIVRIVFPYEEEVFIGIENSESIFNIRWTELTWAKKDSPLHK